MMGERRLLAPAETVNGVTVGAANEDSVTVAHRRAATSNVDPYNLPMTNPSSALGPGFAQSVKPDFLMPGSREHLRVVGTQTLIAVRPAGPARAAGLKVAAPPRGGLENCDGFTGGSSAAAALASRTAHRIHDALEAAYGNSFLALPSMQRAVLLKALLVHPARWPGETAALIRRVVGPADRGQHVRQRDNIRRFLGYGYVDASDAVACAADRATFWATGMLARENVCPVSVPIPASIGGQSRPHFVSATLAWFTPTLPGRKSYRSVRLKLVEPDDLAALRVTASSDQPDVNQTNRGTIITRWWEGDRAPVVAADGTMSLTVQREPDQGAVIDEPVPFGLAVTIAMPGVIELYEEVRQRLGILPRP
jgi:hypothetical protein